ncbi:MAG: glycosyltransferase family 2 protein [Thermoanaerobacter sp.]|nr:glycosyltransferase family 2 protein [Thermoanaerobacter sp.]
MASSENQRLRLSFDLYTRNHIISAMLDAVRDKKPLKILDVGGYAGQLKMFLQPGDELHILDLRENKVGEENYHQGDICAAPFSDGVFDVVVSSDVYEHIPPCARERAFLEMLRISKGTVILGCPFDTPFVAEVEQRANEFFKVLVGQEHPWLREHIENGLPDPGYFEKLLENCDCTYTFIAHNNLLNWLLLQGFVFCAYATGMPEEKVNSIYALYNEHFDDLGDFLPLSYRRIYFISRLKNLPLLPSPIQKPLDARLLEKLWSDTLNLMHEQAVSVKKKEIASLLREFIESAFRSTPSLLLAGALQEIQKSSKAEAKVLYSRIEEKERELQDTLFKLAAIQSSLPFKILDRYNRLRQRLLPEGTQRYQFYRLCVKAGHIALDEGLPNMFRRAWRYFRKYGFKNVSAPADYNHMYQLWIEKNEPKPSDFSRLREEATSLSYRPRISIVMPVYNVDEVWLRKAIESVRNQIYPHWELCIADDGSTRPHIRKVLEEYRQQEDRIKVTYLPHNQGISVASNTALALATGEFVGLLDHDDELAPWALLEIVKLLNQNPDLDFIYSDEDKLELDGRRSEPFFKPDFSPDLLMSMNYICHFSVFRRSLLNQIGGFRKGFEGSQDYDIILRVSEQTCKIAHIPKVLYHWRKIPGSASGSTSAKSYAHKAAVRALEEALERRKLRGKVTILAPGRYRIQYEIADELLVSIIIPTKDKVELLRRCIESIREKTTYRKYEIIVVDNGSKESTTIQYLRRIENYGNCRVVVFNQPFNYSRMNNFAVTQARGDYLVFLNNDTEVITPEWLEEMVEHAQRKEVGAVGTKLLFPDNTIQHDGVIVGLGGVAGHAFYGLPANDSGYMDLATVTRNCSAVTAACLMLRRAVFEEVGGFDEELDVAYNDVDLCLRIIQRGYYIVWTPYAVLYHHESATRGQYQPERNIRYFCEKWRDFLDRGDPFYNPNLALDRSDFMVRV